MKVGDGTYADCGRVQDSTRSQPEKISLRLSNRVLLT
jgi:hypothetical protein